MKCIVYNRRLQKSGELLRAQMDSVFRLVPVRRRILPLAGVAAAMIALTAKPTWAQG